MIDLPGATAGPAAAANPAASPATRAGTNTAANAAANPAASAQPAAARAAEGAALPERLTRACLAVLRAGWTTLALVATDVEAPAQPFAAALVQVSRAHRLRPVRAVDAAGASAATISRLEQELSAARGAGGRLVVTVDDPRGTPAAAALLVRAEAVVIVVRLGATEMREVEQLVDIAGRERVLGAVAAR